MVSTEPAIGVTVEDIGTAGEAERCLLGCLLRSEDIGGGALDDVAAAVGADDFSHHAHRILFRALLALRAAGVPATLDTVYTYLRKGGHLADLGGADARGWLVGLWESQVTGALAHHYADEVKSEAKRRALKRASAEVVRELAHPTGNVDELAARCEQLIFAASGSSATSGAPRSVSDLIGEELRAIDDRASGCGPRPVLTGFAELDTVMCGMEPEQLVVVGARPSVGKSAFALGVAANVAATGTPVLFSCLEMSAREMAQRLLAVLSGVPLTLIRSARLTDKQATQLIAAKARSERLPLMITDTPKMTPDRMAATVRRAVRRDGVGLVVIDYLQLMEPDSTRGNRNEEVSVLSRRMKLIARECKVPVVLLSQLNRAVEGRNDKPRLSDLRESGSIEQDADAVILLSRQGEPKAEDKTVLIDVDVKKARNGTTGTVSLRYVRAVTRFENAPL